MTNQRSWRWLLALGAGLVTISPLAGANGIIAAALLVNLVTVPILEVGFRRWRPFDLRPWRMLQIAVGFWLLANVLRGFLTDHALGPSDLLDMAGYGLTALATRRMGRTRAYRRDPTNLIDALIAVGGLGVLVWIFLMVPYLRNDALGQSDKIAAVIFSLLSMAMCTFTLRLAMGPGARNPAFYLLAVASFSGLGADVVISLALTENGSSQGWQLPASLMLAATAMTALCAASWHPSMRDIAVPAQEPIPAMTPRRLVMMTMAVLVAPIVLILRTSSEQPWTVPVVVGCWIAVSALVMVRLAGLVQARTRAGEHDRVLASVAEALLGANDAEVPAIVETAGGRLAGISAGEAVGSGSRLWLFGEAIPPGLDEQTLAVLSAGRLCSVAEGAAFFTRPRALGVGIGSASTRAVLAPLLIGRTLGGVLAVAIPQAEDNEDVTQALGRLAREAALALERSNLIAETERRAGERRFKALVEHSRDVALQLDEGGCIRFATPAAMAVFGVADEDMVGRQLTSLVDPDHEQTLVGFLTAARSTNSASIELRLIHHDHGPLWCELIATDLSDEPTVAGLVVTARAIDERKTAEQRLGRSEARFRSLVQHSSDLVAVVDSDLIISYVSPSITRVLGHHPDDLIEREFLVLVHPEDRLALRRVQSRLDPSGDRPSSLELRVRHGIDQWRTLDVTISDLRAHPAVQGIVLNAHDVSERKELELDLARQAHFDDLTGLANRVMFRQRLSEALAAARFSPHRAVAVLFLDLNEFKTVNDSMGHSVGDDLLAIVGRRIAGLVGGSDTAARLGGDEFAILVVSEDPQSVVEIGHRLHRVLAHPVAVGGREIAVSGSVGVAYADNPAMPIGDLLRNADTAMYAAKRRGLAGAVEVFDPSMLVTVTERLELMNDLGRVLERDELVLYYQPLVDLATGRVKGFEALSRWQHPTRGIVGPGSFVPLAEEIGLIVPITHWVLDTALAQLAEWNDRRGGLDPLTMSVNLSGRHLEVDGAGEMVAAALSRHRVAPETVVVELTEGLAIDLESPDVHRRLLAITDLGVKLAADDFGAGFASYANLQRLPYSVVKIDRSVVDGLENVHEQRARVQIRSIIDMAHGAQMTVVAEGVEGAEQVNVLRALGCDVAQGFYFSRPVTADQAEMMLFDSAWAA